MTTTVPHSWQQREDFQLRWAKTWEEPHMQAGLAMLLEMGFPNPQGTIDLNTHALNNSFREGYHETITNIGRLKPQKKVERLPEPKPFAHLGKKAAAKPEDR